MTRYVSVRKDIWVSTAERPFATLSVWTVGIVPRPEFAAARPDSKDDTAKEVNNLSNNKTTYFDNDLDFNRKTFVSERKIFRSFQLKK